MAGEFRHGAAANGLAAGLRELDWLVAEVDLNDFCFGAPSPAARALNRVSAPLQSREIGAHIVATAEQTASDLFIAATNASINPSTLAALGRRGVTRVAYLALGGDGQPDPSARQLRSYDLIITTSPRLLAEIQFRDPARRVALLRPGYAPQVHWPREPHISESDYCYDICFSGSASGEAAAWLADLPRAFPNRRLAVTGFGWQRHLAGRPRAAHLLADGDFVDAQARLRQCSRINVVLPAASQEAVTSAAFEIPACGGFMLHMDHPSVRALYQIPDEVDVFRSRDQLYNCITYYLERPELRRTMIERARRRCVPAYSLASRGAELAELLPLL